MNSDPYDSAAWRTFGMLDSDESGIFDEAMRHDPLLRAACHEMNRLGAGIAASSAAPIPVRPGQFERLQIRLGLLTPEKRSLPWLGISGWAAAAVLALMLILGRTHPSAPDTPATAASGGVHERAAQTPTAGQAPPTPQHQAAAQPAAATQEIAVQTTAPADGKTVAKVETKRLIQEIEVLRENLEQFQQRDRLLFDVMPGRALPLVMTMVPPGEDPENSLSLTGDDDAPSPLTAMLGDALAAITRNTTTAAVDVTGEADMTMAPSTTDQTAPPATLNDGLPAAIPIYDAARDAGTLVVSNLPALEQGQAYHLWVTTNAAERPIYVGSLPENSASGSDSFDFSLGSSMVLPSGFVLTKDPAGTPAAPGETNTVLQGPPAPKP